MAGHPTYHVNVIKLLAEGGLGGRVTLLFFLVVFMVSLNPFVLQSTETAMVLSVIGTRGVYSPSIIRCSASVILAGKAMEKIVQVKCKLW